MLKNCITLNRKRILFIQTCSSLRKFSNKFEKSPRKLDENTKNELNQTLHKIGKKYKIFEESDIGITPDMYENETQKSNTVQYEVVVDTFAGLNLTRGLNGVFEIEDLVEVLRKDNAEDIFVSMLPENLKYVDYICIVTGKSYRHMLGIAQTVRQVYKQKRFNSDIVPHLEGETSKDWMALDLGNVALHIFSKEARKVYDLDMLWSVGPKFDQESNKQDLIVSMLEKHCIYLGDLKSN